MRFWVLLLLIFSAFSAFGQTNATVFKKTYPYPAIFRSIPDSGYAFGFRLFESSELDMGIFSPLLLSGNLEGERWHSVLFDKELEYITDFEMDRNYHSEFLGWNNQKLIVRTFNYLGAYFWFESDLTGLPDNTFSEVAWEFDPFNNEVNSLNFIRNDDFTPSFGFEPFPGASDAFSLNFGTRFDLALLSGDHLIQVFNLVGSHEMNDNTPIGTEQEYGFYWHSTDLVSNETMAIQVNEMESDGSVVTLRLFESTNEEYFYHVGVVRGANTEIGLDGTVFDTWEGDSLFHIYLRKEPLGEGEGWTSRIFSYNNFRPDSIETQIPGLRARMDFTGAKVKNSQIYLSANLGLDVSNSIPWPDTVQVVHFFGDTTYHSQIDSPQDAQNGVDGFEFRRRFIYKLNDSGEKLMEFSFRNSIYRNQSWPYFPGGSSSLFGQKSYLFEIGDLFATPFQYTAVADTSIEFLYKYADGEEVSTWLDLPSGSGNVILWLNEDLAIVDHWVIPYTSIIVGQVQIDHMSVFNEDSILVQGNHGNGVLTSLDPFGEMSPEYYPEQGSFITFISAPEILSARREEVSPRFEIYPNPSLGEVLIQMDQNVQSNYLITSIDGKRCASGLITSQSQRLDLSGLENGIYLITLFSDSFRHTEKVVLQR